MRRQSEYWKKYLSNSTPCLFPPLTNTTTSTPTSSTPPTSLTTTSRTPIPLTFSQNIHLRRFCAHHAVTPLTVFQLTWAILLAHTLQTPDIIFGYRENATFDNNPILEEESIYRLRFPLDTTIPNLLHRNNTRSPRHRAFQTGSVPATLRLAGYRGQRLFNTFLYVEPATTSSGRELSNITRVYDLVVRLSVAEEDDHDEDSCGDDGEGLTTGEILCSESLLSSEQAGRLAGIFTQVLDAVLLYGYSAAGASGDAEESPDELEVDLGLDLGLFGLGGGKTGEESSFCAQKRVLALRGMEVRYQGLRGMLV